MNSIKTPSAENISTYKKYRNMYNTVVRLSRKMYYASSLFDCRKDQKKTWEILKEVTTNNKSCGQITEIKSSNGIITDPSLIAEEFNNFFANVGSNIVNSIPLSHVDPLSYIPNNPNIPPLTLNPTGSSQIIDLLLLTVNLPLIWMA